MVTVQPSPLCYKHQAMKNHFMVSKPHFAARCISAIM